MGIKIAGWQEQLIENLELRGIHTETFHSGNFFLLKFKDSGQLVLNLISIEDTVTAEELQQLLQEYQAKDIQLVQLWEDIWINRPSQVLSRICSVLGKNKTIHGRKTKIITVTQAEADLFFEANHLQSSAKARHKYALVLDEVIVAVASFSAKRKMTRKTEGYTSVELVRFAAAEGITVQGGLSKLIRHMIRTIGPNDVMTYADLDWSYGKGYVKLGFELAAQTPPSEIWLDQFSKVRYFPHRLSEEIITAISTLTDAEAIIYLARLNYKRIFNTGNLKYILYL